MLSSIQHWNWHPNTGSHHVLLETLLNRAFHSLAAQAIPILDQQINTGTYPSMLVVERV